MLVTRTQVIDYYATMARACLVNAIHDPGLTPAARWLEIAEEYAVYWQEEKAQ